MADVIDQTRQGMHDSHQASPTSRRFFLQPGNGTSCGRLPEFAAQDSDKSDAPSWLIPVFAFLFGVILTSAVLAPTVITPDYVRGQTDGYAKGYQDGLYTIDQNREAFAPRVGD